MRVAAGPLVTAYRYTLGPLLATLGSGVAGAPRCKYHPSCSQYAGEALREHGLARGSVLAAWRLVRCNPWSHGGVDRVEDQRLFRRAS
jgi:putative membrane protein insertion efficiency factor